MKKETIKPATAAQILKALGISKKRQAAVLARYAASKKRPPRLKQEMSPR